MRVAFADFEVDAGERLLRRSGALVDVEPRVFDLLLHLLHHRERVVPREELLAAVWPGQTVSEAALRRAIQKLRRALQDDVDESTLIRTVRGVGYQLVVSSPEHVAEALPPPDAYTGRAAELGRLRAGVEAAARGRGGLFLVVGEPGIGKSRTIEELAHIAQATGAVLRVGRCFEGEGAPPFWPWIQVFRQELAEIGADRLRERLGRRIADLIELVPELEEALPGVEPPPPLDPVRARFRVFDAIHRYLQSAARDAPMVLTFDDLHRADLLSIGLIRFVAPSLHELPLLVVCAYREADLLGRSEHARVMAETARKASAETIELEGLSAEEVALFVERVTDERVDAARAARLREATGGNPFFVKEAIRAGWGLEADTGRWAPSPSIREAAQQHLAVLPASAREILGWAAVIGRRFDLRLLQSASGVSQAALEACLDAASRAHIIDVGSRDGESRCFVHDLLREVVIEEHSDEERARMHERVADLLERLHADDLGPYLPALADHAIAAAAVHGDVERAVECSIRAARWEAGRMAYEGSADRYLLALDLLESSEDIDEARRCDLLLALAEQQQHAGRREMAERTFERAARLARRLESPVQLARAALGLAPGLYSIQAGAIAGRAVERLEQAMESLGTDETRLRVRLLARLALAHLAPSRRSRASSLARRAVELAARDGDPLTLCFALCARHATLFGAEELDERLDVASRIGELARRAGAPELELAHHVFRTVALLERGDVEEADREIGAHAHLADHLRHPQSVWFSKMMRGTRDLLEGRFAPAQEKAEALIPLAEDSGDLNLVQGLYTHRGYVALERGELPPSLDDFQIAPQVPADEIEVLPALAFTHAESGRIQRAQEIFDRIAAQGFRAQHVEGWLFPVVQSAEVCAVIGDARGAEDLEAVLRPWAGRLVVLECAWLVWGSMSRILGQLAATQDHFDRAEEDFEDALSLETRVGARPWRARTHHAYAEMLLRRGARGDRERAVQMIQAGLATTRELDMRHVESKLLALLSSR